MKRSVSFIVFFLFLSFVCAAALCGCTAEDPSVSVKNAIPSFDSICEVKSEEGSEKFLVKSKKYNYDYSDLMIIQVDNLNEKNVAITVNVSYYDSYGELMATESKTCDELARGSTVNLLFWPDYTFDTFAYTIESDDTESECPSKEYSCEIVRLLEGAVIDYERYHPDETRQLVWFTVSEENNSGEFLDVGDKFVILFGDSNNILSISRIGATYYYRSGSSDTGWRHATCRATSNGLDALKKDVYGIVIPEYVHKTPPVPDETEEDFSDSLQENE